MPKATGHGIQIFTEVKTETTPDGKTKTTKTDNLYNSVCSGSSACVITKTTSTTTTTKSASGTTESVVGSCTGKACPDKDTNPDGDGDGFGDCIGENCGAGEGEGTASSSEVCDVPPACDGDPFSCAILKQSWFNSCAERAPPTPAQQQELDDKIDAAYAANEQHQTQLDNTAKGVFNSFKAGATGGSEHGSGTCLRDQTFSFLSHSIVLPFSQVCPFLALFRQAMLAIAYLLAARIISTQL